jgi:hypothetical protein
MGAGLGFKDFTTGEVLTANDVDGYLMQGVWVFASAAARDAAVTSPQEGNFCYLKDTNVTQYYSGSAWTAVAVASGGWTLESTTALSGSSVSITVPTGYKDIEIWIENYQLGTLGYPSFTFNSVTTSTYRNLLSYVYNTSTSGGSGATSTSFPIGAGGAATTGNNKSMAVISMPDYENTAAFKMLRCMGLEQETGGTDVLTNNTYSWLNTAAITSIQLKSSTTWGGGTAYLYGVK